MAKTSMINRETRRSKLVATAAAGKMLIVSTHTTSHATRRPSSWHARRAAAEASPNVGSAPKTSIRTLVSTAVITWRRERHAAA